MGTITSRKRRDGTVGYTAQIRIKKDGALIHSEAETFDRKQAARAWLSRREQELSKPGALEAKQDPKLIEIIDRYIAESPKVMGRTKTQVLRTIKTFDFVEKLGSRVTSADIVDMLQAIGASASTRLSYLSHLGAVYAVARPAWGYPLDPQVVKDASVVAHRMGVVAKSRNRNRRPTLPELDLLMEHFGRIARRRRDSIPMQKILAFAIFSTRRLGEIIRIQWKDYEAASDGHPARVLVRDMKHPGEKEGNDIWCELPPEAAAIIESMPRFLPEIFPFSEDAISASFIRACKQLGITGLRFHDFRHEGVSRLFEMGLTIPLVASVSGHRSWHSLQRYSHVRKTGDKYENWKWKI